MRFLATLLVVFVSANLLASDKWAQEPTQFRGVAFGTNEADALKTLGISATNCGANGGNRRTCFQPSQLIGDVPTEEVYEFADGKLVNVIISFSADKYSFIHDVFVEKYGQPMQRLATPVKTKAGAEFVNEELAWSGDHIVIGLHQYSGSIASGMATIADREWSAARMKEAEEAKKKAAHSF